MTTTTMQTPTRPTDPACDEGSCAPIPQFDRLNYFYGQMLSANDFKGEQRYFREKLKLHNRCLHGHGVVCGLNVKSAPWGVPDPGCLEPEEREKFEKLMEQLEATNEEIEKLENASDAGSVDRLKERLKHRDELLRELHCPARVLITCGLALDCEGNELVVRDTLCVDVWQHLSNADRKRVEAGLHSVYISLCYESVPIEPTRPIQSDLCMSASTCHYGKTRDSICVVVSIEQPKDDERCEPCCEPCGDPCYHGHHCVLLAEIRGFQRWVPVRPEKIRNEVRRPLSRYQPVRMTGVNWIHGGTYPPGSLEALLPDHVLMTFSRPVRADTLRQGIIDVLVLRGGKQFAGNIQFLDGDVKPEEVTEGYAKQVRFQFDDPRDVYMEPGDRLLIILRSSFVLDKCCHPVDGEHFGGWIPLIDGSSVPDGVEPIKPPADCPGRFPPGGPWGTGDRNPGGSFESWVFIAESADPSTKRTYR